MTLLRNGTSYVGLAAETPEWMIKKFLLYVI